MKQLLSSWTFLLNSLSMDFKTKTFAEHHGLLGESVAPILLKCLHLLYVNGFDIRQLLHFHCKWGPESDSLPHFLHTLSPVSCLISLQLDPWGVPGLKIAEVILQNKCSAKAFSFLGCLSKNVSPWVKTCVVQVVKHPHQSYKISLPKTSLQGAKPNHKVSSIFLERFIHVWFLKILLSCSADSCSEWHTALIFGGKLLILTWEYHHCSLQGLHGTAAKCPEVC